MGALTGVAVALGLLATLPKWLRVAQREHYGPGRVTAIARLWLSVHPVARWSLVGALVLALALAVATALTGGPWPLVAIAVVVPIGVTWPLGLAWRGAERPLAWTSRLRRLALVAALLALATGGLAYATAQLGEWAACLSVLLVFAGPVVLDLALTLAKPVESRLSRPFVTRASSRLRSVRPLVVGITGSYGKTTTKNYLAHLLAGSRAVVASPASFNNLLGLSKAINENVSMGTEVFVAEMGTYGPGEIADMCSHFPPSIAAITSIGDVHLERMKSRETIARAKAEIFEHVETAILCVDYPELSALADEVARSKSVVRVSGVPGSATVDVRVTYQGDALVVEAFGETITVDAPARAHAGNVASAVALALACGVPVSEVGRRLKNLPEVPHRAQAHRLPDGPLLIDDTFNSNPLGAKAALDRARSGVEGTGGRGWVITPGMVEMGHQQAAANVDFGRQVVAAGMTLVVVGHVNRRALLEGAKEAATLTQPGPTGPSVHVVASRAAGADHVLKSAGRDDVVLYENDLPDHYP